MAPAPAPRITEAQAASALRRLDVPEIEAMLAAGWDPNAPFNEVNDGALNMLLSICEWNPANDRQRLVLAARTLLDGGARLDARNTYGDTAYGIAAAPRYCGPDHPVGDRCLADYAGARAARGRR